jgi:hypothetical protein
MLQIKDSVVVVINTGIWYHDRQEYRKALDTLTALLLKLAGVWEHHPRAKYIAIVFAETTSQHFHTTNGYYDKRVYKNTSRTAFCKSISNTSHSEDWRNDVLWGTYIDGEWGKALQKLPHVLLDVLPMQSLTQDLADLHLRQGRHDCTHYCYTPMLYQPIYSRLESISKTFLALKRPARHGPP